MLEQHGVRLLPVGEGRSVTVGEVDTRTMASVSVIDCAAEGRLAGAVL